MKYRKTALIEAVQYHVGGVVPDGVCLGECVNRDVVAHIHTKEGDLTVSDGDWVATGVQGEHWAIKPDIFAASYEPADVAPAGPQADTKEPRQPLNRPDYYIEGCMTNSEGAPPHPESCVHSRFTEGCYPCAMRDRKALSEVVTLLRHIYSDNRDRYELRAAARPEIDQK